MARGRHRTRVNENDERFQQAEEHKDIDNEAEADEEAVFGYSESDNDEGPEEAVTQDDQKFKSVPLFDLDHASGAGGIKVELTPMIFLQDTGLYTHTYTSHRRTRMGVKKAPLYLKAIERVLRMKIRIF
eukprot:Blabericola_migrator_1__10131@NODE_5638_length_712_cov_3_978295_g3676_i0_p1_GENE_NODE_5638_length_712_cov_3_978295_g3676_i0NODE_5638_length_712_cov_3_978295_g3676_i0_p1_ORF_typecomplete_len129_score30_98_NODE_5638_length_712_cov_3_978295_g3676_i0259645